MRVHIQVVESLCAYQASNTHNTTARFMLFTIFRIFRLQIELHIKLNWPIACQGRIFGVSYTDGNEHYSHFYWRNVSTADNECIVTVTNQLCNIHFKPINRHLFTRHSEREIERAVLTAQKTKTISSTRKPLTTKHKTIIAHLTFLMLNLIFFHDIWPVDFRFSLFVL